MAACTAQNVLWPESPRALPTPSQLFRGLRTQPSSRSGLWSAAPRRASLAGRRPVWPPSVSWPVCRLAASPKPFPAALLFSAGYIRGLCGCRRWRWPARPPTGQQELWITHAEPPLCTETPSSIWLVGGAPNRIFCCSLFLANSRRSLAARNCIAWSRALWDWSAADLCGCRQETRCYDRAGHGAVVIGLRQRQV